jgi:hypothetical protein
MSKENQNEVKIEFIELTDKQAYDLSKCNKCSLAKKACQSCGPHDFEPVNDGYYVNVKGIDMFHHISEAEKMEFDKCLKFDCYYKDEPAGACPPCFYWERHQDHKEGYYKEIKS